MMPTGEGYDRMDTSVGERLGASQSLGTLRSILEWLCFSLKEELDHLVTNDTFSTKKIKGGGASVASPPVDCASLTSCRESLRRRKVLKTPAQRLNGRKRLAGFHKGLQISQLKHFWFFLFCFFLIGNDSDFTSFAN